MIQDFPIPTPFEAPYRLAMGLINLKEADWLKIDNEFESQLKKKKQLLATRHDAVSLAEYGSEKAQKELLYLISTYLLKYHRDKYIRTKNFIKIRETSDFINLESKTSNAIELAARLVQEDLCLLEHKVGAWRLTAATVCFPTRWKLSEKMNQTIDKIHDPVPGYNEKLASPVSRFLDHLKVERPVWRLNWSLVDDPDLFQPNGHNAIKINRDITNQNAGNKIWLRIERQTLRRLKHTGAIIFTIRIQRWPLRALKGHPDKIEKLRTSIETMPDSMKNYKSLKTFGSSLAAFLKEF